MMLNTMMILELLGEQPGRYIQHCMGDYCMKEASGDAVTVREVGKDFRLSRQPSRWTILRPLRIWFATARNTPLHQPNP